MIERLIIRLASEASQKNHWLIWSDSEDEIIASGEVDNAEQLTLLTEKAQQRAVICLLPSADVSIRAVTIKGAFNRQMQKALPYLIEEELASDVETLHFSVIGKQTDLVHVAICDKQKIANWLSWLETAQIRCAQFIPEGLALPVAVDGKWQAVQLDKQWIVRENQYIAWSCEQELLASILISKRKPDLTIEIESYSPSAENTIAQWSAHPLSLPMEVLTKGTKNNNINVLTGEFKIKNESDKQLEKWRIPAFLSILLFAILMLNLYQKNRQIEKETLLVKQHVESVYQQAFPLQSKLKYARIKKKLKSMLGGLEGEVEFGFLALLNELLPAFVKSPSMQVSNIKFDSQQQELRILASGDTFQAFELFNAALPEHLSLEQGPLSSSKGRVSGLITIRSK